MMQFDEFLTKFRKTIIEFKSVRGKDPTLEELLAYVEGKILKPRTRGLKSLKGMGL